MSIHLQQLCKKLQSLQKNRRKKKPNLIPASGVKSVMHCDKQTQEDNNKQQNNQRGWRKLTAAIMRAVKAAAMTSRSGEMRIHSRFMASTNVIPYASCWCCPLSITSHQLPYGSNDLIASHTCTTCSTNVRFSVCVAAPLPASFAAHDTLVQ